MTTTTTRRVFLRVVGTGAGALGVGAALPFGALGCGGGAAGPVEAGNVANLAEGTVAQVIGTDVLVGRDAGGVYALSAICTHFGCNLNEESGDIDAEGNISCNAPCGHGSVFDKDGAVVGGPASRPLQHWLTEVADDGTITVTVGTEVGVDERADIPAGAG